MLKGTYLAKKLNVIGRAFFFSIYQMVNLSLFKKLLDAIKSKVQ